MSYVRPHSLGDFRASSWMLLDLVKMSMSWTPVQSMLPVFRRMLQVVSQVLLVRSSRVLSPGVSCRPCTLHSRFQNPKP